MKINLAKSAGFCSGVERAINIALETARTHKNVVMLGDIVHNEDVVKRINQCGIKTISRLQKDKNKTLLIRAHGASLATLKKAHSLGYKVVDATCPMVKSIHKIARKYEESGAHVIVIGDKKHDEVLGIIGQLKAPAIIIEDLKDIKPSILKKIKKAAVVVQSTQNIEKTLKIVKRLKLLIKELKFCNTICRPTSLKQEEIRQMPKINDVMVIIGSKSSANTKRLYQIAKALNKKSYWIQSKADLKRNWFKGTNSVGVTAGASTPNETIKEVVDAIGAWHQLLELL
jgi:4-hydroxy-3-methylbut-2-en-1-yl diphosphate reductase